MSGTACEERLMKDQRDLESIELYLTHKARCHLGSRDTPKSSRKAWRYLLQPLCAPLSVRWEDRNVREMRGGELNQIKERDSHFSNLTPFSNYRHEGEGGG